MKSTLRRGAAVAVTALALGTGLAACGGSGSNAGGGAPVWPGVGGTTSASPAAGGSTSSGSTPSAAAGGSAAPGSAVNVTDMSEKLQQAADATQSAHLAMSFTMMGQDINAKGDVVVKPVAEDLTMTLMGMNVEIKYVDNTIYMKLPAAAGLGDKWIKATAQELGSASGMDGLGAMTDPLAMYTKIGGAITRATYVGTDSTGEHYSVQVDTKQMMSIMGVPSSEASSGMLPKTLTEDLWFDNAAHVVQAKVDLGSEGKATITMSGFGEPVHITAPPAGQVEDMSGLRGVSGL